MATAIKCSGFGAHDQYEINARRCEKIGATQWCEHCHKAMDDNTGWKVNWKWNEDALYPLNGEIFEIKLVGNECVKRFLDKQDYATHAVQVGA